MTASSGEWRTGIRIFSDLLHRFGFRRKREILTHAAVNEPVSCGGIVVQPGDFVYGDSNGVVVIPAGLEVDVLGEAVAVESRDQEAAKRILAGAGFLETMNSLGRAEEGD